MKVDFAGRNIVVPETLKVLTQRRLKKIERFLDDILEVHVILGVEKHRHSAEVALSGRWVKLNGVAVGDDLRSALGQALDKIEMQSRRHKEKLKKGRRRIGQRALLRTVKSAPTEEELALAAEAGRSDGDSPRVVRASRMTFKPMSVEEAALQVSRSQASFLVFRNARTDQVSVLYKRDDGQLGLIES
jgi:putative sigma-54 modulation protein